ncbi:hypothetical protein B0H16DRAFT_1710897 [Mycena metata]|uniref:F-box domain-containing protein n=1 Tax=Mycena metata TaxID=1033252 RepID=A0AAD7KBD0_9AGAR|nr:hypothetical protein B0H16DRAFT_1710897 [Mycena metata]
MTSPETRGIHRLPMETLCDVFRLVVAAATPEFSRFTPSPSAQAELERVANAPLLRLSQVSSCWHDIAMHTPTLWSDVELLTVRLERTRDAPLSVKLAHLLHPPQPRIFGLLAQHSPRWQTVAIACSLEGVDYSILKGRLPRLKKLLLNVPQDTEVSFGIAPCLHSLTIVAPPLRSESLTEILRRKQLRSFGCLVRLPGQFQDTISLLPELPFQTEFFLTVDVACGLFEPPGTTLLFLLSITAEISSLFCAMAAGDFDSHHSCLVLGQLFDSLTVPNLRQVLLASDAYPRLVLEWPQAQFLAFSQRSHLDRHLKTLRVAEVRIAESDLLEILSLLKALDHLEVGDVSRTVDEGNSCELITDSFLRAMLWTPG